MYAQLNSPDQKMLPPRLRFDYEAREDREKTIETGIYTPKNVVMVYLTTAGSKDEHPAIYEEWIKQKHKDAQNQRIPYEWVHTFQKMYEMFMNEQEIPETGIAIRSSLMFSPAEQQQILAANIRTLEELAECNETAIAAMGMSGRAFKERAKNALAAADQNKVALQIEKLSVALEEALSTIEEQREIIKMYEDDAKKARKKSEAV